MKKNLSNQSYSIEIINNQKEIFNGTFSIEKINDFKWSDNWKKELNYKIINVDLSDEIKMNSKNEIHDNSAGKLKAFVFK